MPSQAGRSAHTMPERRFLRHKVHSPAYATKDAHTSFILPHLNEIVDIGEGGMCFQNATPLEPKESLKICLDLSETKAHIEADGEIIWSNDSGRTGVRFQKISKESLHQLREWLFINSMIACVNHPNAAGPQAEIATFSAQEYSGPLLPDHGSALAAVAAIGREVVSLGPDVDAALQLIADRALSLTRSTGAAIALSGSNNLICRASAGSDAPPVGTTLQSGSGFSGECVRTGQLLHCVDSETDLRVDQPSCKALGVRSMIAAPVRLGDSVIGLLEVFSPQAGTFTDSDQAILLRLTEIITGVIARAEQGSQPSGPLGIISENGVEGSVESEPEDESATRTSLLSRLLLALTATAVIALLGLIAIPRVRSKTANGASIVTNPTPFLGDAKVHQVSYALNDLDGMRRLAERGDASAQFDLGLHYATGDKVKQDYNEAARWFAEAADHGNSSAQSILAGYYWNGTGVSRDLVKAYYWAILARANGNKAVGNYIAELASSISSNERDAAQQQAEEWLKRHGVSTISSTASD